MAAGLSRGCLKADATNLDAAPNEKPHPWTPFQKQGLIDLMTVNLS